MAEAPATGRRNPATGWADLRPPGLLPRRGIGLAGAFSLSGLLRGLPTGRLNAPARPPRAFAGPCAGDTRYPEGYPGPRAAP